MSSAFQNFLEYKQAVEAYNKTRDMPERYKKTNDAVLIANADNAFKDTKLEIFKKDLDSFTRLYEFISQIVDYDDKELEKLSLYRCNLRPLLLCDVFNVYVFFRVLLTIKLQLI